jgi:hypothetical protein
VCGEWLVPLVRLVKRWVAEHRVPLRGYHVEAMVYWALNGAPADERVGFATLLRDLATAVLFTVPDIWPHGEPASTGATAADTATAHGQFLAAAVRADAALAAEAAGRVDDAHAIWHELFGPYYPETGAPKAAPRVLGGADALRTIRTAATTSANSAGMIAPAAGYAGSRSSTRPRR